MKIADLVNEHGLKLFKGDKIFFGLLWGFFGALLVAGDNALANVILAMNVAFLIRGSLDYLNHRIATSIIFIVFLMFANFSPYLFLIVLLWFIILGIIEDRVKVFSGKLSLAIIFGGLMIYYPFFGLIYGIYYTNWIIFWALFLFTVGYDLTKYIAKRYNYK